MDFTLKHITFEGQELQDAIAILRLWNGHQRYLLRRNGRLLLNDDTSGQGGFAISSSLFPSIGEMEMVDLCDCKQNSDTSTQRIIDRYLRLNDSYMAINANKTENTPVVDPVYAAGVCYCRECIHRDGTVPGQPNIQCGNMHDDDFCSYGEKKIICMR